jgi:hypothetical protein
MNALGKWPNAPLAYVVAEIKAARTDDLIARGFGS